MRKKATRTFTAEHIQRLIVRAHPDHEEVGLDVPKFLRESVFHGEEDALGNFYPVECRSYNTDGKPLPNLFGEWAITYYAALVYLDREHGGN